MKRISLFFPGVPVAQGRPRFGQGQAYDPPKSAVYKHTLQLAAKVQMRGKQPLSGALWLSVLVAVEPPKSWSKKRRDKAIKGDLHPVSRPDLSNYVKGIEDALNGICWQDDSTIVEYREPFGKIYADRPGVTVSFGILEAANDQISATV